MATRKEMIPARKRVSKTPFTTLCGPEWQLLCSIRRSIVILLDTKYAVSQQARNAIRKKLKDMLADMDDTFNDWPEGPK